MKLKHTKVATLAATLITFGSLAGGAKAAITITQFDVTGSNVAVSITGDLNGAAPGSIGNQVFYFGVPGDGDWISASGAVTGNFIGSTTGANTSGSVGDSSLGDHLRVNFGSLPTTSETFSGTVNFAGTFTPANINVNDVIVAWGRNGAAPDASAQVGSFNAVPEPSSTLLFITGALGFVARRKRTN